MADDPHEHVLAALFTIQPGKLPEQGTQRLFREVLPDKTERASPDLIEERVRKRSAAFEDGSLSSIPYQDPSEDWIGRIHLDLLRPDQNRERSFGPSFEAEGRPLGMALQRRYNERGSLKETGQFFRSRMLAVFDVLQPPWGCADLFDRIGFGTDKNPKDEVHWLNFYGPDDELQARALADELGVEVDERDWGGFVVQAWEDPFDPPEENQPTPDPTTVQAPASPLDDEDADQYPRNGVLVAGIDPFETRAENGETLASALAGERADVEALAGHVHAARSAGGAFDPGELRLFPSFRHNACVLGLPVAQVRVTAETPPIDRLDRDRLEEGLQEAGAALEGLDVEIRGEPELFLVMCDTAGTEGI